MAGFKCGKLMNFHTLFIYTKFVNLNPNTICQSFALFNYFYFEFTEFLLQKNIKNISAIFYVFHLLYFMFL